MAEHGAPRVVLLARAGDARERISAALGEAGIDVALVADPVSADPAEIAAAHPQAVLVSLDPVVEDSLDRFDALLSDPNITVIFDEAELAAQREGWEAARWARHLAAKLNRHDNVLPPGFEGDGDMPSPGKPQQPILDMGALDIAAFADEAQEHAVVVPRDDGLVVGVQHALEQDFGFETLRVHESDSFLSLLDADETQADANDAPRDDGLHAMLLQDDDAFADSISLDVPEPDGHKRSDQAPDDQRLGDNAADTGADDADLVLEDGSEDHVAPDAASSFGGGLSLVDPEEFESLKQTLTGDGSRPAVDPEALSALEARASSLSLADVESYGQGPLRGAVLIEGGLGGPDAVRQLLAEIPEGFPRPIFVHLQLDGGRYDRLVKQMQRATKLDVTVAEDGGVAEPGTIYFIPPSLGLVRQQANLTFTAQPDAMSQDLLQALPANDSAVLFLSGSDAAFVDVALAHAREGAIVAGQSPEGSYDSAASTVLLAHGATTGSPVELATHLADRWPS